MSGNAYATGHQSNSSDEWLVQREFSGQPFELETLYSLRRQYFLSGINPLSNTAF
jgi:hypothetical protein